VLPEGKPAYAQSVSGRGKNPGKDRLRARIATRTPPPAFRPQARGALAHSYFQSVSLAFPIEWAGRNSMRAPPPRRRRGPFGRRRAARSNARCSIRFTGSSDRARTGAVKHEMRGRKSSPWHVGPVRECRSRRPARAAARKGLASESLAPETRRRRGWRCSAHVHKPSPCGWFAIPNC
jgi:hypothetical protein